MKRLLVFLSAALLAVLSLPLFVTAGDGASAEEKQSLRWCQQAVALDIQREGKQTDPNVICSQQYMRTPTYWKCVYLTMEKGPDLFSAVRSCDKL